MITMIVKPQSWINCDGFDVVVTNGDNTLFSEGFRYGYHVSIHKKSTTVPYVTDVLNGIVIEYEVDEIIVKPGKYRFSGRDMGEEEVQDFINTFFDEDLRLLLDEN